MKLCKHCGETKPLDSFYRHKLTSDGRNTYCKPCVVKRAVKWQEENRDKHRAAVRKCNKAHPARLVAATKKWVAKNLPRVRACALTYQKAHPVHPPHACPRSRAPS